MRCVHCGRNFAERVKICPYCGVKLTGLVNAIEMTAAKVYVEEKFHGERGHGFAAERANNLYDNLTGNDAKLSATTTRKTARTEL
ncbi:MAG: hypothetical protein IJU91_10080 [Selenomonadaceae bacterium]|nr:hypothetical protein [Selenomonadaceae bacterium]